MPSLTAATQAAIAVIVMTLITPLGVHAECVTVPSGYRGPVAKPTLVFSGTVTARDLAKHTVSIKVERVWEGQVRRDTTLFVTPVVEGAHANAFEPDAAYLIAVYSPVVVFGPEEVVTSGLPSGTLGVMFGCGDGPVKLGEASESLKRLGRGRLPRP